MEPLPVEEDSQIRKNAGARLRDGVKLLSLDALGFEGGKKALHQRIVVRISLPTHTEHNAIALHDGSIAQLVY